MEVQISLMASMKLTKMGPNPQLIYRQSCGNEFMIFLCFFSPHQPLESYVFVCTTTTLMSKKQALREVAFFILFYLFIFSSAQVFQIYDYACNPLLFFFFSSPPTNQTQIIKISCQKEENEINKLIN